MTGINPDVINRALDLCKLTLEWPPSIAEFISICEKLDATPSVETVFQSALRREFDHPLTEAVFLKVGSWEFRHDSEIVLREKVKKAYHEIRIDMRMKKIEEKM